MTPIAHRDRAPLLGIGGTFFYLVFAAILFSTYDEWIDGGEWGALILFGLGAIACFAGLASLRRHRAWHVGKIGILWAIGLIVSVFSPARAIALPLLIAAAAFTWVWLPDKPALH